jgi:hypothetical protein
MLSPGGQVVSMSLKNARRKSRDFFKPSPTALAVELLRVKAELQRRLKLCDEFRAMGFDNAHYADLTLELRDVIPTPLLDGLLDSELIHFPAPVVPFCIEVHRRLTRLATRHSRRERLLHHEVLILLASISVQRAISTLLEETIESELNGTHTLKM